MENNIHIVYVAYDLNGLCMYVGEGKPDRWKHLESGVSHVYEANRWHFNNKKLKIEIIAEGLSKKDALALEAEKIKELYPAWNKCEYGTMTLMLMTKYALGQYKQFIRENIRNGRLTTRRDKMRGIIKDLCKVLNRDGETLMACGQKWSSQVLPAGFMSHMADTSGKYYVPLKYVFDVDKVEGGYKIKLKGWVNTL